MSFNLFYRAKYKRTIFLCCSCRAVFQGIVLFLVLHILYWVNTDEHLQHLVKVINRNLIYRRQNFTSLTTMLMSNDKVTQLVNIPNRTSDQPVKINETFASRLEDVDHEEYKAILSTHASTEKVIVLALVDTSFLDMTFNFYETSILKHNITNYLFIASDKEACDVLQEKNIHCFVYMTDKNAKKTTVYKSRAFNQKMNLRTFFVLDALTLGFAVLHTDVDIVFFRNPLIDLQSTLHGDVACLWDNINCNAGFLYIRPSNFTISVYKTMKKLALTTKMDDQTALNKALASVIKSGKNLDSKKQRLDDVKYQCGLKYFELGGRYFAKSSHCPQCIVVHNNWIVSKEAKRYRFRELLLWSYDDDHYYSNTTAKYLTYFNPKMIETMKNKTSNIELDTLKAALYLGHRLGRLVILPRFHLVNQKKGSTSERPLNNWIKMSHFDGQFYRKYRENSFLLHPKIPAEIRKDVTAPFWIKTSKGLEYLGRQPPGVTVMIPKDEKKVTAREIVEWFGNDKSSVLNFHSLYGIFGSDVIPRGAETRSFYRRLDLAFKTSDYRQLKN